MLCRGNWITYVKYVKPVSLSVQQLGSSVPVNQTKVMFFFCLRSDNKVTINFINRDGEKITVKGLPGDSLLDVVINEDLDFDGFGTHRASFTGLDLSESCMYVRELLLIHCVEF